MNAAGNGTDVSKAVKALGNALSNGDCDVRWRAAATLVTISENRIDISESVEALGKALSDENANVRWSASEALANAAQNGADVSGIFPALCNGLSNIDIRVRLNVSAALKLAAGKGDHKTREMVISSLMEFMNSGDFIREACENSDRYGDMLIRIADIVEEINMELDEAA